MTTQNNIFKSRLKFSQKTSISNVNVSNDTFVCLKLESRIHFEIRLDGCNYRYYTNSTYIGVCIHLQNNHIKCAMHIVAHI